MQRKWIVSLIVCTGVFMSSLDLFIVNIAFPAIAKHFGGASLGSLSWVLSAYAIVFAALLVPAGRWADAFGRKRAFLLGLGIFVAASAACALAPSVGFLIGARVVQAAGGALMLPTSLGLMLPEFEPHERHVAIGAWAATGGIAAAAGPPLGGLLVQADWRLVFLVNIPVGLLGLGFGLRTLAERRERNAARPDVLGALALIVAIGALVVAIVKGQEWGWGSASILALLARDGRAAAGDLVALGTPRRADRRAGDAARAQLRPGRRRLGAVLRRLRRDAARRRAVPHVGVARERADGRADAVPRPGDGDRVQHPLGTPRRALRLPLAGDRRRGAVLRRVSSGTSRRPATRRHTSRSTCRAS